MRKGICNESWCHRIQEYQPRFRIQRTILKLSNIFPTWTCQNIWYNSSSSMYEDSVGRNYISQNQAADRLETEALLPVASGVQGSRQQNVVWPMQSFYWSYHQCNHLRKNDLCHFSTFQCISLTVSKYYSKS